MSFAYRLCTVTLAEKCRHVYRLNLGLYRDGIRWWPWFSTEFWRIPCFIRQFQVIGVIEPSMVQNENARENAVRQQDGQLFIFSQTGTTAEGYILDTTGSTQACIAIKHGFTSTSQWHRFTKYQRKADRFVQKYWYSWLSNSSKAVAGPLETSLQAKFVHCSM